MNHTIYLHPRRTDQPEALIDGGASVSLELSHGGVRILGGFDEDTAAYMDRLEAAARVLAQTIRERCAARKSYGVTI